MGLRRTDDFRVDVVRIVLTNGQEASDLRWPIDF